MRSIRRMILPALLLMALGSLSRASAQEIDATVSINDDQLSFAARQEVAGFADELERYIDNTRWTDQPWEGERIRMNFSVVFTGSSGNNYAAKLLVGSSRGVARSENQSPMMKILDEGWTFTYQRNQPFIRDASRYDDLTGILDFYVFLALGLDMDTYGYRAGTSMYEKAWRVAQLAQVRTDLGGWGTQVNPGSYSRYGFIRELTEMRFYPLRKFIFDYYNDGVDQLADNRGAALDSINSHLTQLLIAVEKLVQPSVLMRVLNDAKNVEFSEMFIGYPDETVWRKLRYVDPGHKSVYDAAQAR
jgi:hypothetical protein